MKSVLKLGTRKSLLAWAQSSWVARELERLHAGLKVELVGIETRGDKILDVSLQSVEGKEFFVAELDDALRAGRVDLTVHSMKDLSLDRPREFKLAAIPKRENPRDVILFSPEILNRLRQGKKIKIGTSSPRRLENIPEFLRRALPQRGASEKSHSEPELEFLEIRGNVNTRLSRVRENESSEKYLDGVVLAFAGLIRLWADEAGQKELRKLLTGVRWMVLPLKASPAAPAQGALAIECLAADAAVLETLSTLHHTPTEAQVSRERELLARWGGGCHQKFGATSIHHPECGDLFFVRGKKPDQDFVDELHWQAPAESVAGAAWDGNYWRALEGKPPESVRTDLPDLSGQSIFIAHWRAVASAEKLAHARVWTSGTMSWFKLAQMGVWVEGCAEGLGFDFLKPTLNEPVLSLPALTEWSVLTHDAAESGWQGSRVISTYRVNTQYPKAATQALNQAENIFWSSGSQYDELKGEMSKHARSYCGPGKTAEYLRQNGVRPTVFPSVEEWRKWLKI